MSASNVILNQIMNDFAELARLAQHAMEAEAAEGGSKLEALQELRDLAFLGAASTRCDRGSFDLNIPLMSAMGRKQTLAKSLALAAPRCGGRCGVA